MILPSFVIVKEGRPYLRRRFLGHLLGRGLMLHRFYSPDMDPDPHDHPWDFVSVVLSGGYVERLYEEGGGTTDLRRTPGTVIHRRAEDVHQIVSVEEGTRTLLLTGPRRRRWGFHTEDGFRDWRDYLEGLGEVIADDDPRVLAEA